MAVEPTYVFQDDGTIHVYHAGKVLASGTDMDELEKLAIADLPTDPQVVDPGSMDQLGQPQNPCPQCGGTGNCSACAGSGNFQSVDQMSGGDPLPGATPDTIPGDDLPPRVTHITTPSGLKGHVLGKVRGLWGDQVTVRLENGRIAKFDVTSDEELEKMASTGPEMTKQSLYGHLEERLAAEVDPTQPGMRQRIADLRRLKDDTKALFSSADYVDTTTLHNIIITADAEIREVTDALAALEDAEAFAPPAPFDPQAVEQESVGGGNSTWLDDTLAEMMAESEATDFDQEMTEAPEVLVSELETPALEDERGVAEHALSYVRSKTAGLEPESVKEFTKAFLGRVEQVRQQELISRIENAECLQRQASSDDADGPAEGLFL